MIYRRASVSDHAVAGIWANGGSSLALPIGEAAGARSTSGAPLATKQQRAAAEQAKERRRRLVATRRPVTLTWLENRQFADPRRERTGCCSPRRRSSKSTTVAGSTSSCHRRPARSTCSAAGPCIRLHRGPRYATLCGVMFAAEHTVVELLAAGRELPDAQVGPNGRPVS